VSDSSRGWRRWARLPAADLAWLGLVPGAVILVAALGAAPRFYGIYPEPSYPFYDEWMPAKDHPEPLETVRFMLTAAMPLALAAVVLWLGTRQRQWRSLDLPVIAVQLAGLAFVAYVLHRERKFEYFDFQAFSPYLLPAANLAAAPLIGVVLTVLALRWDDPRLTRLRRAGGRLTSRAWPAVMLAVGLTALWLLPAVITDGGLHLSGLIPPGHVPIEFDEFVAVSNGRTPLVDYVPWYGAVLPILLSPLWPLFDWSITSFTITMVLLSLAGFTAVYWAFRELTGRAWVALALYVPFMASVLQPWTTVGAVRETNGSYFANYPERYLGPFVILWLCARYLRRGSPPVWVLFFAAGLTLVNNPEFGAACLVSLILALVLGAERETPLRSWVAARIPQAAAGLAGAFALIAAVILVRSGELPNPDLFGYPSRLARHGYTLAPMPPFGLHWLLYLTYLGAVLTAAVRYVTHAPDRTLTGMLAFAGIFGLSTAGYFAGRSLPWQLWGLLAPWGLALALLGWTAWLWLRSADRGSRWSPLVAAIAALSGFGLMVAAIDRFPPPWQQVSRIAKSEESHFDNYDEQRFIEERTEPGERVLILGWELDHRIAERAGVVNVSPWFGAQALLGPNETKRALDQLAEEGGDTAFLRIARRDYVAYDEGLGRRVAEALRERGYVRVGWDPISGTVEWKLSESTQGAVRDTSLSS